MAVGVDGGVVLGERPDIAGLGIVADTISLRSMRTLLLIIGLISVGLSNVFGVVAAEHLPPGHHRRQAFGDGWTYDLLVPQAATTSPTLPVLFLFSPGGNPDVGRWKAWAETNSMLVMGVNDSRNGVDSSIIARMQKAASSAVDQVASAHPFLRYSAGFSGGGWCAMYMAQNMGDAHAGALVMGHHLFEFDFTSVPKHVPAYFLWGEQDPAFGERTMIGVEQKLTGMGFVTRFQGIPGVAHTDPAFDLQQRALEVLIELASVTHPRLNDDERRAAWTRVAGRITALDAITDRTQRLATAERLFQVPGLEQQRPMDHRQLIAAWFDASFAQGEAESDPVDSHRRLDALATNPRAQNIDALRKKKLTTAMTALRKQPAVKAEVTAAGYLTQIQGAAEKAKGVPSKLKPLMGELETLMKKYPQTQAAKDAAKSLEDLRRQVR